MHLDNQHQVLKSFFVIFAFWVLAPLLASSKQPNVVLILADDVSPDMFSIYGQEGTAKTPNIDQIALDGVRMDTCIAPAICGPSRALLMTGVYANTTGAFRNDIWVDGIRGDLYDKFPSWAKTMRGLGYATAIAGKWHAGAQMPYEDAVGFEEYCLWEGPSHILKYKGIDVIKMGLRKDTKQNDVRYWHPSYLRNGEYVKVEMDDFGPDIDLAFLKDFMTRQSSGGRPFVAYWPASIPHGPYVTTPKHDGPDDRFGLPPKRDYKGLSKAERDVKKAEIQRKYDRRFVNLIEYMDDQIGELKQTAKDLGIYDNTYFIFCADNGTATTAKDRGVERGVHVPFVISGPGVTRSGNLTAPMDFSDIAATLLDIGGASSEAFEKLDGKSLLPYLSEKADEHKPWAYAYTGVVQVFRTEDYLLEARSPFYGKPDGRSYFTAEKRFGEAYNRIESDPEHQVGLGALTDAVKAIDNMGDHLGPNHPFWSSKSGKRMLGKGELDNLKLKQLYSHPDYVRYDERD